MYAIVTTNSSNFLFTCDSVPSVFRVYHHCYLSEMDLLGAWMWICSHGYVVQRVWIYIYYSSFIVLFCYSPFLVHYFLTISKNYPFSLLCS